MRFQFQGPRNLWGQGKCGREGERERERERERQTDRQTDRLTDRESETRKTRQTE